MYVQAQHYTSIVWSGNKSPGREGRAGGRGRKAAGNDQYYDNSSLSRFILPRPPSPLSNLTSSLRIAEEIDRKRWRKNGNGRLRDCIRPSSCATGSGTATAAAAMFRRRGRGLPVAPGNRSYPDIDLGATRRVARLLSGRENVITALWWLR